MTGNRIRQLRQLMGWSLEELASRLNITRQAVYNLEKRGTSNLEYEVYINDTFKEWVPIKVGLLNAEIDRLKAERDMLFTL